MNLKRVFIVVTVLAAIVFCGALAGQNVLERKVDDADAKERAAYHNLTKPYYESGAPARHGPVSSVDDIILHAIEHAGQDSPLSQAYREARSRLDRAETAYRTAGLFASATVALYALFLPLFGAAVLSRRTRTRDQRAGLAIACLSEIPATVFAVRCINKPLATHLVTSPEFYVILAILAVGAVVASGVLRKLKDWITSGAKD